MIAPVTSTAILLFLFLLFIIFAEESLVPLQIKVHELSEEAKTKQSIDVTIPSARGNVKQDDMQKVGNTIVL